MKKLTMIFCVFVMLVVMSGSCLTVMAENMYSEPLYYVGFDSEYYEDSIGNAYGFDSVEYIDVADSELVSGALRLSFEKSPYPHMGAYNKSGYTGEFDPFFSLPLYEIEEDIKCEDVCAIVITVRLQDTSIFSDRPMLFFDNSENTVIDGDGDFLYANSSYRVSSDFQNIIFYTKGLPKWQGVLQGLRIDPFNVPNDKMDYYDIAGIAFFGDNQSAANFKGDYINLSSDNDNTQPSVNGFMLSFFCAVVAAMGFGGVLCTKRKRYCALLMVSILMIGMFSGCENEPAENIVNSNTELPSETVPPEPDDFVESRENSDYRYDVYERHVEITKYIGMKSEITVPETIDGLPVTVIGYKAFFRYYCHDDIDPNHEIGVEKLILPDSLEIIEDYGLAGLEECDSIIFGSKLKKIGNCAVQNCFALKELTFKGNNLESIGAWAFANCISVEKIEIPSSLKTVGAGAFMCCRSSKPINFSENVVVGKGVQFGCTPIKNCININKWIGA